MNAELPIVDTRSDETRRVGWRMVAIAVVIQNVSTGLAFGSFGSLILSIEKAFGAQRDVSSLTVGLLVVSFAITGSVVGRFVTDLRFRPIMLGGVGLCVIGFLLLSVSREMWQVLAIYTFLLGPGSALTGAPITNSFVARWVPDETGRALGLVNMTVLVIVVPALCGLGLQHFGLRGVYFTLALCELALAAVVAAVIEPPAKAAVRGRLGQPAAELTPLLRRLDFWTTVLAIGIIFGGASMKLAHFVPLLISRGYSSGEANLLLGISGGAGVLGSISFGWLADRIGPARSLIVNALVQASAWIILLSPVGFGLLVVDAVAVGACTAGVASALGVLITRLYGATNFARVYGSLSFFVLPFLLGAAPLAGVLYRVTGNYTLPVGLQIGGFVLAALLFGTIRVNSKQKPAGQKMAAA